MADFEPAVAYVLDNESGNFVNNAADRGGPTKWGITLDLYTRIHPGAVAADIEALDRHSAVQIYREVFWLALRLQSVVSQGIATAILDGAANFGARRSLVFAQRACGAVSDGLPGEDTLRLLNAANPRWVLVDLLKRWQDHYVAIVVADHSQLVFLSGWLARARRLTCLF